MKTSNTFKALNRAMGKALHSYGMIADGDRIVVGVSGGADSLTLMWMLAERLKRVPINYELFPVYIDPGYEGSFGESLAWYGKKVGFSIRTESQKAVNRPRTGVCFPFSLCTTPGGLHYTVSTSYIPSILSLPIEK